MNKVEKQCCRHPRMYTFRYMFNTDDGKPNRQDVCVACGTEAEPYYVPEIGQAVFGNPCSNHDFDGMPEAWVVESMLSLISYFADGDNQEYISDVFELRPYYWGDDEAEAAKPNFRHHASGLEIRWYKHLGRGMSVNKHVCPNCFYDIFAECMNSLLLGEFRP